MYYAQFYYIGKDGHYREALGTDQVCPIDGRLTLTNMIQAAQDYAYRIRNIHKFDGFAIMCGDSYRTSRVVTTIMEVSL